MQKQKLVKLICCIVAATSLPGVALSKADYKGDYKGEYVAPKKWSPVYHDTFMSLIIGGGIGNVSDDNPTITRGTIVDQYPVTSNSSKSALVGINTGIEYLFPAKNFSVSIGVGAYTATAYKFKGNLVETIGGGTPTTLYNYKYQLSTIRLMLEGQVNWLYKCFAPFVNAGVGPAWVRAKGYEEVANNIFTPPLPAFRDNTRANLGYQVGAGISYLFNPRDDQSPIPTERFTLGYQYVGFGDVNFRSRSSTFPQSLDVGQLNVHEIYFRYTHYF